MIRSFTRHILFYILWILSILTLALMAWAVWLRSQSPYDGIEYSNVTSIVTSVDPNGPAAGLLEKGDLILAIDGKPLSQVTALHLGNRPGHAASFIIERQGQNLSFEIPLTKYPGIVFLKLLSPLLVSLLFWVFGLLIFVFQKEDIRAWFFTLICLLVSSLLATGSVSLIGPAPVKHLFYILLWWPTPLLFHFHLLFPFTKSTKLLRVFKTSLYAIAFLGTLLDLVFAPAIVDAGFAYPVLYLIRRTWLAAGFVGTVLLLARTYHGEPAGESRSQVGVVVLGSLLAIGPILSFTLIPEVLFGNQILPYAASFLFLSAMPASYGYAIYRFRLIPFDRYINRGVSTALLFTILSGLYLVINAILVRLIPSPLWEQPVVNMILVLLTAVILERLHQRLQAFVDYLFYGGWYDYQRVVTKVSQTLEPVRDAASLARSLSREIKATMQLECACIALVNGKDQSVNHPLEDPPCLSGNSRTCSLSPTGVITQYFQNYPVPVKSKDLSRRLVQEDVSEVERGLLACKYANLWMPIRSSGQITALLILSSKKGGAQFTSNDMEILEVIGRQAGIALENLRLVAELSVRDKERVKLHQQALRAAEGERKKLARELHDRTIQALIGVNFHLAELRRSLNLEMQNRVDQSQSDILSIIGDIRGICAELRPPAIDSFGLAAVVRSQVRLLNEKDSFHTVLEVRGDETMDLPEEVVICTYRVLQEALLNSLKHSDAQRVQVKLSISPDYVRLIVQDDGKGFLLPERLGQLALDDHFGLLGMYERVELVNGKLAVYSHPGQGCQIEVEIPYSNPRA